jgi:hypothetical protein
VHGAASTHVLDAGAHAEPWPHWVALSLPGSQVSPTEVVQVDVVVLHTAPAEQSASLAPLTAHTVLQA